MSRPDQSITFLREFGYSVFRLPRASAQPLEVMHRDGKDLSRLGVLEQLIEGGAAPPPTVHRDATPGIDLEGKQTSRINVAIGVNILGSFIGALGGGNLGLSVGFKKARTVTFTYTGVMEDRVDVLALESFVHAGSIRPFIPSGTLDKLIDDDVYVVTAVLKTKRIVVSAQGEAGTTIDLEVPIIRNAIGGSVKTEADGDLASTIAFQGETPVAFAFQAVQLVFDDDSQLLTTQQLEPGGAAARAVQPRSRAAGGRGPVFLQPRGAFVRVDE